jgi:hypothetical protein
LKPRRFAPRRGRWPDGRWRCHRHAPRFSQSGHLRSCLTPSVRTVRPAPVTDSPAFQPLHSSRSSPAFRKKSVCSMPGFYSFVSTAANCRDRQSSQRARPKCDQQRPRRCVPRAARTVTMLPVLADRARALRRFKDMVARLRPTRTSNSPRCFARARHRNTARGSACRRGHRSRPRGFARPKHRQ